MRDPVRQRVTAHGLDRSVESWVLRPEHRADVAGCIEIARARGLRICPAGGRNSFGDVFLLGDHASVDMRGLSRILAFDPIAATITVEAGARECDVIAHVMPLGFQLGAVSGSLWNTIAGNLSSNVNGKDAWRLGTFGEQVESFRIVLADGSERLVDRASDRPLFEAVVGGLGLLGIVTEVTLRLHRIPSWYVRAESRAAMNVAEMIDHFGRLDPDRADFSYAWLDAYARGRSFGRGVCESARFTADGALPSAGDLQDQLEPPATIFFLPPAAFWGGVRFAWRALFRIGVEGQVFRALGAVKHARARRAGEHVRRIAFPDYQYPMAKHFPHWNLKFAPEGFNEVQALFPTSRFEAALRACFAYCAAHGRTPEVSAVRRHRAEPYPLAFSGDGLSITLPFSLAGFSASSLEAYRRGLAETILHHGGKVYLSKFPYLDRAVFAAMYPGAAAFAGIKQRVDPERLFWSEAAARLLE